MKKRKWIMAAAFIMGLLFIITAGLFLLTGIKNDYKSAKELADEAMKKETASETVYIAAESERAGNNGAKAEITQNDTTNRQKPNRQKPNRQKPDSQKLNYLNLSRPRHENIFPAMHSAP